MLQKAMVGDVPKSRLDGLCTNKLYKVAHVQESMVQKLAIKRKVHDGQSWESNRMRRDGKLNEVVAVHHQTRLLSLPTLRSGHIKHHYFLTVEVLSIN